MELPSKMSTKMVRFEQSDLAGFLLQKLKRGLWAAVSNAACNLQM